MKPFTAIIAKFSVREPIDRKKASFFPDFPKIRVGFKHFPTDHHIENTFSVYNMLVKPNTLPKEKEAYHMNHDSSYYSGQRPTQPLGQPADAPSSAETLHGAQETDASGAQTSFSSASTASIHHQMPPGSADANGYTAQWSSRAAHTPDSSAFRPTPEQGYTRPSVGFGAQNTVTLGTPPSPDPVPFGAETTQSRSQNGYPPRSDAYSPSHGPYPPTAGGYPPYYGMPEEPKKKPMEKKYASRGAVVTAIILAVVLSLGCGIGGMLLGAKLAKNGELPLITPSGEGINIYHNESNYQVEAVTEGTIANVASRVSPAVVEIYTDTVTYSQYFGQQIQSGAGSGVIITKDGYIITCAHVIDDADKITVRLNDGKQYEASLVGSDPQTDIAVVKINAEEELAFVPFGSSDNLVVGQPIVVVGNPLGALGGTVTNGIISATNREIEIGGQLYNLLQTNAAINSGNSGGGMFDMNGNLVGVVNAKSAGESIEGLGFAIPSSQAEEIATELMAYGYVKGRPTIGVTLLNVNSQEVIMNYFQYSRFFTDYGVYIIKSEHDSMELGDRLVAIDGTEIADMTDVQRVLSEKKVGDTVSITVSRLNGRKSQLITVEVALRERTAED